MTARRQAKVKPAASHRLPHAHAEAGAEWLLLQSALDRGIQDLPEKYRTLLVLCDLQGKSRQEAARELNLSRTAMASRLRRARQLLRQRIGDLLAHQGGASMNGSLPTLSAPGTVTPPLLSATVKAAAAFASGRATNGQVSARAAQLAEEALKALLVGKLALSRKPPRPKR